MWEKFIHSGSAPLAKRPENSTSFDSATKRSCSFFLRETSACVLQRRTWKCAREGCCDKDTLLPTFLKSFPSARSASLWEAKGSARPCWRTAVIFPEGSCCFQPRPRQDLQWLLQATIGTPLSFFQGSLLRPGNWGKNPNDPSAKYTARARRLETAGGRGGD